MEQFIASKWFVWVLVIPMLLLALGMVATFFIPPLFREANIERLQSEGIPAQARIVSFRDTGNRFNYVAEFFTVVEVELPGREPYRAEIKSSGGYLPGALVPVRVDRKDPQNVVFQLTDLQ